MRKRRRSAGRARGLGPLATAPLVLGVSIVLIAFFLPWVEYRETLGASRFGIAPPDQTIAGWRIPIFIDGARGYAATKVAEIIRGSPIRGEVAWLVYLSPLTALAGLWRPRRRKGIFDTAFAAVSAVLVFVLAVRGSAIVNMAPPIGLVIRPDFGLWTALFGHAVSAAAAVRIAFARYE